MKYSNFAAALCLPLTMTAAVAGPAKQFYGTAEVVTVAGCGTDWNVGDFVLARYIPSGLTGKPTNTRLTLHNLRFAQAYVTPSGRFATTLTNVNTMFIGAGFGPAGIQATLAQTSPAPASTVDSTVFINMTGKITQFGDTPGCTVTFRAGLALRP